VSGPNRRPGAGTATVRSFCSCVGIARPILCRNCSVSCRRNRGDTECRMHAYRRQTR
jgi:hypothetical protein